MPANIPIRGDDPEWKRKVDEVITDLLSRIKVLENQITYLSQRSK